MPTEKGNSRPPGLSVSGLALGTFSLATFPPCHPASPPQKAPPPPAKIQFAKSKHSSLKAAGSAAGKRSVMKRFERVKLLKERGQWKEGRSAIGLPKTKGED